VPIIDTIGGVTIRIYVDEHNPPHIHVVAAEHEGIFRIDDGVMIEGDLKTKEQRKVRKWLDKNRNFAAKKWGEITQTP
jgi:hypothetical protein